MNMSSVRDCRRGQARFGFFLLLALSSTLISAQNQEPDRTPLLETAASQPASRPRIGLALSGGGALGLAEIGVLQWLEENHIPVDRVARTSMGSIIAAMYASGMSPAEIQKFAESLDSIAAILPEPTYAQLAYLRKKDRRDSHNNAALRLAPGT